MVDSLLSTKLYIPPARTNLVERQRLTDVMLTGVSRPGILTLLSGPAGFGKTTLLSELISHYKGLVAWVSLDEGDNDPARFWSYLIAACQMVQAGVGESALPLFQSPQPLPEETIPTLLINDLTRLAGPSMLVLDDYHVIQNPSIHSALSFLIEHLPDSFHIVLSTRTDPPWPLARWRARNRLVEVRARDLRFTLDEAALFLNRMMGLNLTRGDIKALEERTEGWVAGLQLAAISMQNQEDISRFVRAFTGSHLYVADYLVEEVIQQQPADMQTFLLQTSILERLSAGLCEAVAGGENGQALLVKLRRANLFVVPLDDEGLWFRYHHLFADLLKARLRQALPAQAINTLHLKASGWYEQNGFPIEAVNHALAAGDFARAARLVEENTYPLVTRGELATLMRWINALPEDVAGRRPPFLLAKAWTLLFAADATGIYKLAGQMEALAGQDKQAPEAPILLGSAAAIKAFFTLMAGDHEAAVGLAKQAEALLPAGNLETSPLAPYILAARSVLPYTLGMAYRSQGQFEKAVEAFDQEIQMFSEPQNILAWAIATVEVAVVRRMQGRLNESAEICRKALERITALGVYSSGSLGRMEATLAEALREQNRLNEAYQQAIRAIERMSAWNMPTDRLATHLVLGRVQLSMSDLAGAGETIHAAKALRASAPVFWDLSRTLDMLEIRLALTTGDLASANNLMEALHPGASQIIYLRDQELILLAQLRLAQGRPDEACVILTPLASDAHEHGRGYSWLAAQVQLGLAQEALGKRREALAALVEALDFAEGEAFVRMFLDEGEKMQRLLAACEAPVAKSGQPGVPRFVRGLLDDFSQGNKKGNTLKTTDQLQANSLVEALTARELEVLRLIAAGDSNQAIAGKLVITVSAVKKHTANIYGKLGVNSRTQAVARAHQLGMLDRPA